MPSNAYPGTCECCGQSFARAAMTRHIAKCAAKQPPDDNAKGERTLCFHLFVGQSGSKTYWMHLAVPAGTPLLTLDSFLRRTWLECCGHMSAFSIGPVQYVSSSARELEARSMNAAIEKVAGVGTQFRYEYDFGSTTELSLKVVGILEIPGASNGVALLAMNDPPEIVCGQCDKPATQVCSQCICSGGWLCDDCAEEHDCGEEMMLPVVNSPRVGVCGYSG